MGGSIGKSDSSSGNQSGFQSSSNNKDVASTQANSGSNIINNAQSGSWDSANSGSAADNFANSKSGSNQDVWGQQGGALGNMYNQVGGLAGKSGANAGGQMQGGQDFSQGAMGSMQQPWQNQMQGGAYADMGLQNSLMGSLNQSLGQPSATQEINNMVMGGEGNNYADAMRNQYVNDANRASDNMLQNLDARAAASGMSGGSRHGTATAQGMQDINQNLQRNMAQTGYNTFDKDLDRKLAIAGQADQGTLARQQMMSNMIGGQQGAMNEGINQGGNMIGYGQNQQMMPWQQAGAYSGILGGPTVLQNTSNFGQSGGGSSAFDTGSSGSMSSDLGRSSTYDRGTSDSTSKGSSVAQGSGSGSSESKGFGGSGGK